MRLFARSYDREGSSSSRFMLGLIINFLLKGEIDSIYVLCFVVVAEELAFSKMLSIIIYDFNHLSYLLNVLFFNYVTSEVYSLAKSPLFAFVVIQAKIHII